MRCGWDAADDGLAKATILELRDFAGFGERVRDPGDLVQNC